MLGQKANVFSNTDGTEVPLQINIMTINTWKPAPSPDFPSYFTTPIITSVIVPYYEITRFSANITITSPFTTIYVISPASFNVTLNIMEVPVTLLQ